MRTAETVRNQRRFGAWYESEIIRLRSFRTIRTARREEEEKLKDLLAAKPELLLTGFHNIRYMLGTPCDA